MGYNAKRFGVTKVDLPDGYWAEVAPLTKAQDDECDRALLGGELEAPVGSMTALGEMRTKLYQREYSDRQLAYAIKRWNLDDDAGAILPITVETVQGLADADSDALLAVVRKLTSPLADPKDAAPPS